MSGSPSRLGDDRAIGDHFGHNGSQLPQFLADDLAPDVGAREEHLQAADADRFADRARTTASARYSAGIRSTLSL